MKKLLLIIIIADLEKFIIKNKSIIYIRVFTEHYN